VLAATVQFLRIYKTVIFKSLTRIDQYLVNTTSWNGSILYVRKYLNLMIIKQFYVLRKWALFLYRHVFEILRNLYNWMQNCEEAHHG
jgi:hypothetical protein